MRYVLQSVASEDTVQLFDSLSAPVVGVLFSAVQVWIRKDGESGYTQKVIIAGDWTDRGGGNYALDFSAANFDTLGLFRYKVISPTSAFVPYEDALEVVDSIPSFPIDPPSINLQTDTPPGVTPDPVYRGSNLTINGSDLLGALQVTIGDVPVTIISNTNSQIVVTVISTVDLGTDQVVEITTAGGTATTEVDVVLNPSDIPGDGMCLIYGYVHYPGTGMPMPNIGVWGRVLDMPNINSGVAWTDDVVKVVTDNNGKFEINLPRQDYVEVAIPKARYRRVFVTPDLASANLFTEILS